MAQRTVQRTHGLQNPGQPLPNYCIAEYDFSKDGGAVSQITLRGDTVPSGAYVDQATVLVETAPTSAAQTATISVDVEGAADVQTAVVVSNAIWASSHPFIADKLDAAGEGFKTSADRAIKATIAVQALTAGKFKVIVRYWLPV